jgi:hypothetical protein
MIYFTRTTTERRTNVELTNLSVKAARTYLQARDNFFVSSGQFCGKTKLLSLTKLQQILMLLRSNGSKN